MSKKLGLKCSTSNCGSKPTDNQNNDRISQTPSRNMKNKVEAQPRKVNKKNHVVEPIRDVDVKHSLLKANSELIYATCLSKKAKIVESKIANHSEPNHTWGSNAIDIPSFSSLVMIGCPDCSLVSGLWMFETYVRELTGKPLSVHEFVSKIMGQLVHDENIARIMGMVTISWEIYYFRVLLR
ncbi:hypothetical protein Tco_0414122 [Tanacetum coccineum]